MEHTQKTEMFQASSINNDFLRKAMQDIMQEALNASFNRFIGVDKYERSDERHGSRNGSYERGLNTRVGSMTLKVCRDREGKFHPALFERYQRSEKALVLTVTEMYLQGVSTRNVSAIAETLCGFTLSKDQVSDMVKKLDVEIDLWRTRLLVLVYQYLLFDARYEKVRENGCIVSKAFVTAIGITIEGVREIIGCYVFNSESFEDWDVCFKDLIKRGLKGVVYIVSDENAGLKNAAAKNFQGVPHQRCQVHYMRNFIAKLAKNEQQEGVKLLQKVFAAPSKKESLERLQQLRPFLCDHKKEAVFQWLEESIEDALAVYELPEGHRKQMKSTNMLERFNQELKRRSRVVRIFPNEASCLRLLSALCMEQSEEWDGKRYLHPA